MGLKGNFGTVQLGNLKSAYKYTGGVKYDPFVATVLEARGNGGMSKSELGNASFGHNSFLNNSIGYISPKMNGLSFWATYSPDETGASKGADGDYSLAVKYNNGPLEAYVKAVNNDDPAGGSGWSVGGSYKMGNHRFLGQYESLSDDSPNQDIDIWFLGYHLKSGNNTFVAQLGNNDPDGTAETDYYTIGLIHSLSKKTRATVGYRNTDKNAGGEEKVVAVGLRMLF